MAMVKCSECHHEISDKARICPHCGTEYRQATSQIMGTVITTLKVIAVMIIILFGIAVFRTASVMI